MESAMFVTICLVAAFPLATGLKCYTCGAIGAISPDKNCVDAVISKLESKECTSIPKGQEARCFVTKTEASTGVIVIRSCDYEPPSIANTCKERGSLTACLCNTDNCNGQTTPAPAIVTCLVSILAAVYASW